jgi:hypothetical protein
MSRSVQGSLIGAAIVGAVLGLMAITQAWAPQGNACPLQFPKIIGCVLSVHESLAAGLLAAGGALFAAWIAWVAVQRQIDAGRDLARAGEREAYDVLLDDLGEFLDIINGIWRGIDWMEEEKQNLLIKQRRIGYARANFYLLPPASRIAQLAELGKGIGPRRERLLLPVLNGLRNIDTFRARLDEPAVVGRDKLEWEEEKLKIMRIHFSYLAHLVMELDSAAAVRFKGRVREAVELTPINEQLDRMHEAVLAEDAMIRKQGA